MLPLSVEDLTARCRTVVRATVRQQQSVWDGAHKRIYTFTELAVSEVIHGDAPKTIVVRTMGGEVDGVGMKVSGTARFVPNQDIVVFLRSDPMPEAAPDSFTVVGMSQGLYRLEKDTAGRMIAVPGVEGLAFARRNINGQQVVDHHTDAVRIPFDTLRGRVLTAARTPATPPATAPGMLPATPKPQKPVAPGVVPQR